MQMAATSLPLSSGGVYIKKKHTGKSKLPRAAAATANELRIPVMLFFLSLTSSRRGGRIVESRFPVRRLLVVIAPRGGLVRQR